MRPGRLIRAAERVVAMTETYQTTPLKVTANLRDMTVSVVEGEVEKVIFHGRVKPIRFTNFGAARYSEAEKIQITEAAKG